MIIAILTGIITALVVGAIAFYVGFTMGLNTKMKVSNDTIAYFLTLYTAAAQAQVNHVEWESDMEIQ